MRFFDFFKTADINQELETYTGTANAVLLDVRTPQEYKEGHIPGSRNIPLQTISNLSNLLKPKDIPLFIYCYSGSRSRQAVSRLQQMGYTNVRNIGGIASYSGKIAR